MIQLDDERPLQQQVYRALRAEILSRKLAAGERLPSTRTLAAFLKVSRNTAVLAYDQLAAEGYTESRSGGGTVVIPALADGYGSTAPSLFPRQDRSVPGAPPRLAAAGERMLNNARNRIMR